MRNFRYFLRVKAVLVGVSTRLDKAIFLLLEVCVGMFLSSSLWLSDNPIVVRVFWHPFFLKDKLVIHVLVDHYKIYFDHLAHLLCRHVTNKMLSFHSESQPESDISIWFLQSGKILKYNSLIFFQTFLSGAQEPKKEKKNDIASHSCHFLGYRKINLNSRPNCISQLTKIIIQPKLKLYLRSFSIMTHEFLKIKPIY